MMHSFRFRLAAISVVTSGLVLLVFGSVAWLSFERVRLDALDRELMNFGFRTAGRASANVSGPRTEVNMAEIFGVETVGHRFFSFVVPDGKVTYRTAIWPEGLDPASFSAGEEALDPQPQLVEPPPRPGEERREPPPLRTILVPRFSTVKTATGDYRVGVFANPSIRMVLGADLEQFAEGLDQIRRSFLIALPGALFFIAMGAVFVARRALWPIEVLSDRMEKVSVEGLDQRLEVRRADEEFRRIIGAYNRMMERLEKSFHQATRFSADASHQLKTPLAVMQGTLERAISRCADDAPEQEVYSAMLEEVGKQRAVLESLLLLSRVDAGELRLSREEVDLSALAAALVEDAEMLAEPSGIEIRSEIEPGVIVEADPVLLQQALHNLVGNAVKYNREGGVVEFRLKRTREGAELTVANTGARIAPEERERIFERFYRSRGEGSGKVEGVGLGLSLAREIVAAHGGAIAASERDGMTEFRLQLPVAAKAGRAGKEKEEPKR